MRRTVEAAPAERIGILTLFAFSSDNWRRPPAEVAALFALLGEYLDAETARCLERGVRIEFIGRRDRLGAALATRMERAEAATAAAGLLRLRVAIDYSARTAIGEGSIGPEVDLLIRTGGEQRLSDFLLWECAYAELVFSRRMWPDFEASDLHAAVREFRARERRFGQVPLPPPAAGLRLREGAWLD
jgi:undecaprenyl diphosphate synthase